MYVIYQRVGGVVRLCSLFRLVTLPRAVLYDKTD